MNNIAEEAVSGADVILTIDSKLQEVTEQALKNNIEKLASQANPGETPADAGAAVVLNVKTGEVLAMASYPDYAIRISIKWYRYRYMELLY